MLRCQFLCLCVVLFSTQVSAESVVDEMQAAWKVREARFQTGRIEFENIEHYPNALTVAKDRPGAKDLNTIRLSQHIVFDAKRGRYTREGLHDYQNGGGGLTHWFQLKYLTTFDGKYTSELMNYKNPGFYSHGEVGKEEWYLSNSWDYHSSPVFMAFRPASRVFHGVDIAKLGKPIRRETINGHDAIVFQIRHMEYFFDPAREFVLLRQVLFLEKPEGRVDVLDMDLNYRTDPKWGVVPESWTFTDRLKDSDGQYIVVKVTKGKILKMEFNQPVTNNDFLIEFPIRTVVSDGRSKVKYIVHDDGIPREIEKGKKAPRTGPGFF